MSNFQLALPVPPTPHQLLELIREWGPNEFNRFRSQHPNTHIHFQEARFEVKLCGAYLRGLKLRDCQFMRIDATHVDFEGADLRGAIFAGTSLFFASFRSADLRGAKFFAPILNGADFNGANLEGAQFYEPSFYDVRNIPDDVYESWINQLVRSRK